jgi:SNF2 family DNA or RNA helicase
MTLLLVPSALQPQWSEALSRAHIRHRIICGGKGEPFRYPAVSEPRPEMIVTLATYDRAANMHERLATESYQRIICDEGHVFRNGPRTRRFMRLAAISATHRWILSGTPIQNRKQDLQNLLRFLGMSDEDRLKTPLQRLASTLLMRRTVNDVREAVPEMPAIRPTHKIHPVNMPSGSEEAAVFAALVGRFESAVESRAKGTIVLELYLRIRQFIAHPDIYVKAMIAKFKGEYPRQIWTSSASKHAEFKKLLETTEYKPTIVFGSFRGEMDLADHTLRSQGYKTWQIRGGMTDAQREAATKDSRAAVEAGERVAIVIQIVAGGAGLNLQHCNRVVFLSSHWNPAIVDQAIARAYRMGQREAVEVHHLLLADDAERNIDRYMSGMHGQKRMIATGIHPKLHCDTAVDTTLLIACLDDGFVDPELTNEVMRQFDRAYGQEEEEEEE